MSSSSAGNSAPSANDKRVGVQESDYQKFIMQGNTLASSDLSSLMARQENMTFLGSTTKDKGVDIFGWHPGKETTYNWERERDFKTVSQETLDKMLSMFQMRKKEVDTKKIMPGRSQLQATDFNIG